MSTLTPWLRTGALGASAGMILAPLAFSTFGATATVMDCDAQFSGATEVATGVCEVSFTERGLYGFSAPAGITKLSAVIIGGGGGGWFSSNEAYGGGGGSLYYVDNVDTSENVEIAVGSGGDSAQGDVDASAGTETYLNGNTADGGGQATWSTGGYSGDFEGVSGYWGASGSSNSGEGLSSSAQGEAEVIFGAAGRTFADVVGSSTLFGLAGDTGVYAPGGDVALFGGSSVTTSGTPGAGGAANGNLSGSNSYDGADGAVFLRWATESSQPELPKTGGLTQPMGLAAGIIGMLGASLAVGARYIRKRG